MLEDDNEFAVAVHLISTGPDQPRLSFFEHVRATRLVWPADDPAANAVHAARYLPTRQKADETVLRASLRQSFAFRREPCDRADAGDLPRPGGPLPPRSRSRHTNCRHAGAGLSGRSRFELGLGVEVEVIPTADVDAARNALVNVNRIPAADAEVEGLLRTMAPKTAAEEPEASWLFRACGLRTVHLLASGRLYVSHLPTFGLVMTAATNAAPNAVQSLSADYNAPGDPGGNVVLVTALADAAGRWTAGSGPAYTVLSRADSEAAWAGLVEPAGRPPPRSRTRGCGR